MYTTLISTDELAAHLNDPEWAIFDCRFSLLDMGRGLRDYSQAHIPGSVYAHLDADLSGPIIPGRTGRHPLPTVEAAANTFSAWGIDDGVQVVAYDDAGGALAAGRLWWMLHWLGHTAAAVLDGGWQAWLAEKRPVQGGLQTRRARIFIPRPRPELIVGASQVDAMRQDPAFRVFDARSAERYRGENETIDPVAGHIPGAVSAPYLDDLTPQGKYRSPEELRLIYQALLGSIPADHAAFYCGSGVTSIHNILAMQHAGLGEARLYAGSWSEWITDPDRPIER
ncbi:MAG TPA: sulfurtransferase [Anaerolineales bacterium]